MDIEIVYKYTLGGFWTKINGVRAFCSASHRGTEHKIELAHVSPIASTADRADDAAIDDNLLILSEIIGFFCCYIAIVNLIVLGLFAKYVRIGGAELLLVKGLTELLASLGHFLVHLFFELAEKVLDKHISPVSLL